MRVFVAGATGALGARLVPELVGRGHDVVGMTRTRSKQELVSSWGARPVCADALDADAVAEAVATAEPEVVVHQLTALTGPMDMRRIDRYFAATNRLRTEGTDHLLAAAKAVGARRFVAQSFTGWPFAREGGAVKAETAPLDPAPPRRLAATLAAIRHVERAVTRLSVMDGIVLRYGFFYGPGTAVSLRPDADMAAAVRRRRFPMVGDGGGVWSFVHVGDAAAATAAAVEGGEPGIYQIVDDDPAPLREWLPALAERLGGAPPRRVPRWLGRMLAGEAATVMLTEMRGAANTKARTGLGWEPRYPGWRRGFAEGLE